MRKSHSELKAEMLRDPLVKQEYEAMSGEFESIAQGQKEAADEADAMSTFEAAFHLAYAKATDALLAAVIEFECTTGRVVESIELQTLDVTQIQDRFPRHIRQTALRFLPKPGEVEW